MAHEIESEYIIKGTKRLRKGITTGTCATAAALYAAKYLEQSMRSVGLKDAPDALAKETGDSSKIFGDENVSSVKILTPSKEEVSVQVHLVSSSKSSCECMVIKDSGDDPDVTDKSGIHVCVELRDSGDVKKCSANDSEGFEFVGKAGLTRCFTDPEYPGVYLTGGIGVGRVTKPGLEQPVGYPAINKVPRQMIFEAVGEYAGAIIEAERNCPGLMQDASGTERQEDCDKVLLVTVSVPAGEELAKKTFNSALGIEGGISILGTTGILEPMSEKSIVDTMELEIKQRKALGKESLLITPGNYGQRYISEYLKLDPADSVKCSNFVGEAIDFAIAYGFKEFVLVGNIGKLVKLAAGIMNTHSRIADGRGDIFALHALLCGADISLGEEIKNSINTDTMIEILDKHGMREIVIESICKDIKKHMERRCKGEIKFKVLLFSERYGYLAEID